MDLDQANYSNQIDKVSKYILDLFDARQILPTTNNEKSSRSHIVVCITLNPSSDSQEPTEGVIKNRKLIVCDLACVENQFACEAEEQLRGFDRQYRTLQQAAIGDTSKGNPDPQAKVAYDSLFPEEQGNKCHDEKLKLDKKFSPQEKEIKYIEKPFDTYEEVQNNPTAQIDDIISEFKSKRSSAEERENARIKKYVAEEMPLQEIDKFLSTTETGAAQRYKIALSY